MPLEFYVQKPGQENWVKTGEAPPCKAERFEDNRAVGVRDLIRFRCDPTGLVSVVGRLPRGEMPEIPLATLAEGQPPFEIQIITDNAGPLNVRAVHKISPESLKP